MSRRAAALMAAWATFAGALPAGSYTEHKRQPFQAKGMSAKELGTTGKKKSRRERKSKIQKESTHGPTLYKRTGPGSDKRK